MRAVAKIEAGLPRMATPWRRAPEVDSPVRVDVLHMTDPLCPWAYSFEPAMRAIEMRYGDQLRFRNVLIGLADVVEDAISRGLTPQVLALGNLSFRRFGMPITPHVRSRVLATGPACRLVKAAERRDLALGSALLRMLRLAAFTTDLLLDEDQALLALAALVDGLDPEPTLAESHGETVEAAYREDRAMVADPSRIAVKLGRTSSSEELERYTAPSLVLRAESGETAVVPGFQPLEAVEVALLNLEPNLVRLPTPDLETLVDAYPGGLSSQEVARVLADTTQEPDRPAAEAALTELVATGRARRISLADDALWASVAHVEEPDAAVNATDDASAQG